MLLVLRRLVLLRAVLLRLPMLGYFRRTAARTCFFSDAEPCCATRERAFLAWLLSCIGYLRFLGSAKLLLFIRRLVLLLSFAIQTTPFRIASRITLGSTLLAICGR